VQNSDLLDACEVRAAKGSESDGSELLPLLMPFGDVPDGFGLCFSGEGKVPRLANVAHDDLLQ
jgi:hypothetical protein